MYPVPEADNLQQEPIIWWAPAITAVPNRAGRVSKIIVMYIANQGVIIFDHVKQGKPKGLRLSLHYSKGVARIFLEVGTIFRTPPAWKLNFPTFPDNHR